MASKMRLEVRAGVEDFSCDGQWDCSLCLVQPSQRTLLDRVSSAPIISTWSNQLDRWAF